MLPNERTIGIGMMILGFVTQNKNKEHRYVKGLIGMPNWNRTFRATIRRIGISAIIMIDSNILGVRPRRKSERDFTCVFLNRGFVEFTTGTRMDRLLVFLFICASQRSMSQMIQMRTLWARIPLKELCLGVQFSSLSNVIPR